MDQGLFGKLRSELAITSGNLFARMNQLVNEAVSNGIELNINVETIVATAKAVYDKYIAPVDIPFVPNVIEPAVDAKIWEMAESVIRSMFKASGANE